LRTWACVARINAFLLQGIKFFDPEIVGDTPETVEYLGMRNLLEAVEASLGPQQEISILKVCVCV